MSVHVLDTQNTCKDLFTEPVELDIDVLGPSMVNWVVSQRASRFIVDEQGGGYNGILEIEVTKQGFEPDDVLCCIVGGDLLSPGHPGHWGTTHEDHFTRNGATRHRARGPVAVGVGVQSSLSPW
jgi:hypothetical protein